MVVALFKFRLDVFNLFTIVVINDRQRNVIYRSPTNLTIVNSETLPRLTPRTAGFGAATGAQPMRNLRLQIRLGSKLSKGSGVLGR